MYNIYTSIYIYIYIYGPVRKLLSRKVNFSDAILVGLDGPQGTINWVLWRSPRNQISISQTSSQKIQKNIMDILGLSAVSPRTLREIPRAWLLTRPQNHYFSCADINFTKDIATLHCRKRDKTKGIHNRYFNFTKDVSTLSCKKRDKSKGFQFY